MEERESRRCCSRDYRAVAIVAAVFFVILGGVWLWYRTQGWPAGDFGPQEESLAAIAAARAEMVFGAKGEDFARRAVVLIVIDALRADHLSCYGYGRETSPSMDALAADGMVFEKNKSQSSHTVISMASMFASRFSLTSTLGMTEGERGATMPEVMRSAGYYAAGVQTNPWLDRWRGYERGFDEYRLESPEGSAKALVSAKWADGGSENIFYADADAVAARCEGIIGEAREEPLFLYVHLMDVHGPYIPPERCQVFGERRYGLGEALELCGRWVEEGRRHVRAFDQDSVRVTGELHRPVGHVRAFDQGRNVGRESQLTREVEALYDAEILFADECVGRITAALKRAGLYEEAVVVVAADHGEGFLEHGEILHGYGLYEELVHTPLIVKAAGLGVGRFGGLTRNVDIAETIFEAAGVVGKWEGRHGESVFGMVREGEGAGETVSRLSVRMGDGHGRFGSIERGGMKYIWGETPWREWGEELYDLREDGGEVRDVSGENAGKVEELRGALAEWEGLDEGDGDEEEGEVDVGEMDEEKVRRLKALGYLN